MDRSTATTTTETDRRSVVESYLESFSKRDLEGCMSRFTDDAVIHYGPATLGLGQFRGKEAIEKWHRDRFTAGAEIVKIENIQSNAKEVRVSGVFTSPRLKAVRLDDFRGSGTFLFEGERFKVVKLGLRSGYRFHI